MYGFPHDAHKGTDVIDPIVTPTPDTGSLFLICYQFQLLPEIQAVHSIEELL